MKIPCLALALLALLVSRADANPVIVNHAGANANAQNYGDNNSAASSQSLSHASATGGAANAAGGSATGGTAAGGSANSTGGITTVNASSGSGKQVAASAIAPAALSFNPCLPGATSAAVQTGLFGISFGANPGYDEACRLHQLGQDAAAVAYLCRANGDIRQAYRDIGLPCPQDRSRVVPVASGSAIAAYPFDYCLTRNAGDQNQHLECGQTPARRR